MKENVVEVTARDKSFSEKIPLAEAAERIAALISSWEKRR